MFEQMEAVKNRFEELGMLLQSPDVLQDALRYRDLMKEYRELEPPVQKYAEYEAARRERDEGRSLLEESGAEPELKAMAQEQLEEAQSRMRDCGEELKLLLLPKDADDERSVIVEVRSGTGGEEAALFARDVYRMYTMYAEKHGWKTELLGCNETELGGFKEVNFSVEGAGVYSRLKYESGVHRVQRVPDTENQGRIQTSAVTVAILPEAEEVEIELKPADLRIDTFRSSGAGGQHINKTSSAIRVTHLPTGMVVECQDERSQYKNKAKALKVLRSRLYEKEREERDDEYASRRRAQVGSGDRSERVRTYNFPQGRVTDHRVNLTVYRLAAFMDGDMDSVIDTLITADRAQKLQAAGGAETP